MSETVAIETYEAAVNGRREFRQLYRDLREKMKWRPIETAPRDGTQILWTAEDPLGRRSYAVITYPEYIECFDEGHWLPLQFLSDIPPVVEKSGTAAADTSVQTGAGGASICKATRLRTLEEAAGVVDLIRDRLYECSAYGSPAHKAAVSTAEEIHAAILALGQKE